MVRQEVENLRFSPFFKFFILSPFSHLDVLLYASRCEERRFPLKICSPRLPYFCVTANVIVCYRRFLPPTYVNTPVGRKRRFPHKICSPRLPYFGVTEKEKSIFIEFNKVETSLSGEVSSIFWLSFLLLPPYPRSPYACTAIVRRRWFFSKSIHALVQ